MRRYGYPNNYGYAGCGVRPGNPMAQWAQMPRQPQYFNPVQNQFHAQDFEWQPRVTSTPIRPYANRQPVRNAVCSGGQCEYRPRARGPNVSPRQPPPRPNVPRRQLQRPGVANRGGSGPGPVGLAREMLQRNPVLMVGFSYCPVSKKLKALLDKEQIPHHKWDVDLHPYGKDKMMDVFEKFSGIRTAPQMYVMGNFISDGSETTKLIRSGEFHEMIGMQPRQSARRQRQKGHRGHRKRQRGADGGEGCVGEGCGSGPAGLAREMLQHNPVLMVGFSYCPACVRLMGVFEDENIPYQKWDIDVLPYDKRKMMDVFERLSGIRTVPQVYVRGKFVADGTKTRKMIRSGEFHKMIGMHNDTNIMNAAELVDDMLERHPVLMMSFSYCPCCINLADKLKKFRISYFKFEVDELPNRTEVIAEFEKLSGIRTAPQMYVAGKFVGDGSTTSQMIDRGELQRLIKQLIGY